MTRAWEITAELHPEINGKFCRSCPSSPRYSCRRVRPTCRCCAWSSYWKPLPARSPPRSTPTELKPEFSATTTSRQDRLAADRRERSGNTDRGSIHRRPCGSHQPSRLRDRNGRQRHRRAFVRLPLRFVRERWTHVGSDRVGRRPAKAARGQPVRRAHHDEAPEHSQEAAVAVGRRWTRRVARTFPGHGKTLAASYLVGSQAVVHDALSLGVIVTATHAAGVLALAAVVLFAAQYVLPEALYPWLAMASGAAISLLGLF